MTNKSVVAGLPVEFHCHGLRDIDFSEFSEIDLSRLDAVAAADRLVCLPTLYLPYSRLDAFVAFMQDFGPIHRAGGLPHIAGIALEGPLLASFGGTPERGVWAPTRSEWERLAACACDGLEYIVLSPDFDSATSGIRSQLGDDHPDLAWIVDTLVTAGVRPALGHFTRSDPNASADAVRVAITQASASGARRFHGDVVTDHLFNDMPLAFRHAWRTPTEQLRRDVDLEDATAARWTMEELTAQVGAVPSALMEAARDGELTLCMNFDGEHVDLEYCRRAVELLGAHAFIAMTDRTDVDRLGGQHLHHEEGSELWYQAEGIVAAGSRDVYRQIDNMRSIGLDDGQIRQMTSEVPARVLDLPPYAPSSLAGAAVSAPAGAPGLVDG